MENVEHSGTITHASADRVKVKLIKGQRHNVGWEIEVKGADRGEVLNETNQIHADLLDRYPPEIPE